MAKKYKSAKLQKQSLAITQKPASAFGKHANRLADARKRKIQKLTDTQKRLLESKKNNKMIKVSKKAKKFALLDEDNQDQQGTLGLNLTHRGVNIKDLKEFDDVNLGESDMQNDEQFDNIQDKLNFAGFQATNNLLQGQKKQTYQDKQKTQNQIYKQIIEKSKAYKMVRQQQYEQNLNMANELDEGFDKLVSQLKFRNKDQQLLQKMENRDLEYDKLMNELKEDQRIVSNKIVQKQQKYTQTMRKKKNDQLNKLMKDSDDEDIRGWVDEVGEDDEDNSQNQSGSAQAEDQEQNSQQQDGQEEQEGSYDELDDVNLSSEEQQQQGNALQDQEEVDQNAEQENQEPHIDSQLQQDEQLDSGSDEDQESGDEDEDEDQDQDEQDEDDDEEESEQLPPTRNHKNHRKNHQQTKNQNSKPVQQNNQPKPTQSRQNPQKKRKLNFIE